MRNARTARTHRARPDGCASRPHNTPGRVSSSGGRSAPRGPSWTSAWTRWCGPGPRAPPSTPPPHGRPRRGRRRPVARRRAGPAESPGAFWTVMPGKPWPSMSRIVAYRNHGASIPGCVLRETRHGLESGVRSGTLCGMRVAARTSRAGGAPGAVPGRAVRTAARRAIGVLDPACSTPRHARRTVCLTRTPSRGNMPEALVGVTVRQPCCVARESRSVTPALAVVLAMQRMATIVALVVTVAAADAVAVGRHGAMDPPVRMV